MTLAQNVYGILIGVLFGLTSYGLTFIKNDKYANPIKCAYCLTIAIGMSFGFAQYKYLKQCTNIACLAFGYVC